MSVLWGFDSQADQQANRAARDAFEAKVAQGGGNASAAWEDAKSKALSWYAANDPGLLDRFSGKYKKSPENSTDFIRKMTDLVTVGGSAGQSTAKAAPIQPSADLQNARKAWDADQSSPKQGSIDFKATGNAVRDAADYGNRATDDYNRRFIPSLTRQSKLEGFEIGESGAAALKNFIGQVPELGDPKNLFSYYKDQIS